MKSALNANGLRYAGPEKPVRLFGICGGSGGDSIMAAKQRGCDAFVTADVKHHQFIWAEELDIDVVDAGHFSTENVVVPVLANWISERFPDVEVRIAESYTQPEKFF